MLYTLIRKKTMTCCLSLLVLFVAVPSLGLAQQSTSGDDGLLDTLKKVFKQDYLSIGTLIQAQGKFHFDPKVQGENTFRLPNARLKISGNLDHNVSYTVQANFASSPALLDANITYGFSDAVSITAGAQKPALSGEFLVGAAYTDFINRSRIVSLLAQRRDIGILGKAELTEGLQFSAGMFNGSSQNLTNNNNEFYYTGRLEASQNLSSGADITVAVNASFGNENGTVIGNGRIPSINGSRALIGGDGRFEVGDLLLSGEFLFGELEYGPNQIDNVLGYHITAGYWVADDVQLLGRLDHIQSDILLFESNVIVGGINYNYTDAASFQLNYQLNPNDIGFGNHFVLLQTQIAF